jgi:uncharacterized protein YndB with AHSA1/START domain
MDLATPADRQIVVTRLFAAPPRLVFDAHTRPELLARWFGPHGSRLVVCEIDLRPGGSWYYLLHHRDGMEMTLRGTYLEIAPAERIVSTESNVDCEARAEHESLVSTEFAVRPDGTLLTSTVNFPTRQIRDAVLASGMERGVGQGHDRLAALLAAVSGPADEAAPTEPTAPAGR